MDPKRAKAGVRVRLNDIGRHALRASPDHLREFGNCTGALIGPVFPELAADDLTVRGTTEWDVRWEPSGLRYGYNLMFLYEVK